MCFFSIQDVCLVFSLIIVFLSFFSTYVFQAGLVGLLITKYKVPIFISVLYLALSITYHVCSLNRRWYEPQSFWWTDQLLALFVIHRFGKNRHKLLSGSSNINIYCLFISSFCSVLLLLQESWPEHSGPSILRRPFLGQRGESGKMNSHKEDVFFSP